MPHKTLTAQEVKTFIEAVPARADLAGYAAGAAANELLKNWEAAMADGYALERLLPDITDVVQRLELLRTALERKNLALLQS